MSKCLVTGGAGFIGGNLVDKLIDLGNDVIVLDNESAKSITEPYWNSKAVNYKLDVSNYHNTKRIYQGVDYVFHLAANARVQPSLQSPIQTIENNIMATSVSLQCALEAGVKRFIYSSSSSVYGNGKIPNKETNKTNCLTQYAVSKLLGEELCSTYYKLYGLKTISLRYFNVYGNRQPLRGMYAPVLGLFMNQKQNNEPLTIVGDGLQRRDFTNVEDIVNLNILAATKTIKENNFGQVYNAGTGVNNSILDIATSISNNIIFIPERPGEHKETLSDISKTKKIFNWNPNINIIEWINKNS